MTHACFCKTFNKRGNTSLFLYLLPNTIILGKQPEQPCGGYHPQTTSPNVRHTTGHMQYTSAGVWVHPPTAAFWVLYTQVKWKIWLRNTSHLTPNTVSLNTEYLRYCTKFNRRKMFVIMIKATTKYQQIISLLLPLGSLKKNNQKFNFFHSLRLWAVKFISSYCKRKGTRKAALAKGYMVTRHCSAFSPCTVPLSAIYHHYPCQYFMAFDWVIMINEILKNMLVGTSSHKHFHFFLSISCPSF